MHSIVIYLLISSLYSSSGAEIGGYVLNFKSWKNESKFIGDDCLNTASCTLIIPGISPGLYGDRNCAFMFDGANARKIHHISETDSLSSADNQGNFCAIGESMGSLDELAKSMRQKQSLEMSEVNADFGPKSLVGILAVPSTNGSIVYKLNALVVKKTIREQTGLNVPIFMYEGLWSRKPGVNSGNEKPESSGIVHWDEQNEEDAVDRLLRKLRRISGKDAVNAYAEALAKSDSD